ncbi:MAG: hypothetical protein H7301_03815 [Cryobacterium sp.]|nr:hypothetical protein [Oligoflexia bacterium]
MELAVVKDLGENLGNVREAAVFMEAIEMRQRLFRQNKKNLCLLDPYDLISDHLILRSSRDGKPFAYSRVTPLSKCLAHDLLYPVVPLLSSCREYPEAYARLLSAGHEPLHMGFLCLDPAYRDEVASVKIVDLMIWLGFISSGFALDQVSFTATPNAKFNQDPWLKVIGDWAGDMPDFIHPLIPEAHRMVIIPKIYDSYWTSRFSLYSELYKSLRGEREALPRAA